MTNLELSTGMGGFLPVVVGIWAFFTTLFWMWIGYRAMRAHERIANSLDAPAGGPPRAG